MRTLVLLADGTATATVAGRNLPDHWVFVGALAGLRVEAVHPDATGPEGPFVVIDGRFAALAPESLRALAARASTGALMSPSGEVVAARVAEGSGPLGARLSGTWDVAAVLPPAEAFRLDENPAELEWTVRRRWIDHLARSGVRFVDPGRTLVDTTVAIATSAVVWPDAVLRGATRIGENVEIQPGAFIEDTVVDRGAVVRPYTVASGAHIGPGATVGPFAHLRQGAVLEADTKVGNFVEVKQATLRRGAKASHLSYVGDAEVGAGANLGAGTITCNYDGFGKYRTVIGEGAFVGSNSSLVAPVTIGPGAIVGAGSVVTRDVPADALFVERAVPKLLEGQAPALRERNRLRAEKGTK